MFNSQYYTCEQIDQRLLQGYLDDYNSQNNINLTKEQFLTLLFNTIGRNSLVDNLVTQIGYYECDTAGATAAKAITVANYALFVGGSLKVKFINKNTANNATFNINSQGAKALYYQGERVSSTNSWDEGEVVEIYYDGTNYYANNVKGGYGSGVYDVSVEHPNSGPNGDGKFTLEYILNSNNVNELIPVNRRYHGMSIQFVSTYDNKCVQYRLKTDAWSISPFDWEEYNYVTTSNQPGSDLDFSDEQNNVLVRFANGHVKTKNFDSSQDASESKRGLMSANDKTKLNTVEQGADASGLKTEDMGHADLDFSDENENVLVIFKNGHIKTKNFNSKYAVNFLEKFKGKSIGIVGDSISTFAGWLPSDISGYDGSTYDTYYGKPESPRGDVTTVDKTWWYKLAGMLGIDYAKISNCAWSGSKVTGDSTSTTSAKAGCSDRRVQDLQARGFVPDIIICFISCNDWGNEVQIGTWQPNDGIPAEGTITTMRSAYAVLLNKLHTTYPLSRIFVCTILDDYRRDSDQYWPSNNGNGISTYEWNKNVIELADAFGCEIINFNKCGINYQNIATYYSVDAGLHPNAAGMTLLAQKAFKEIITKY